MADTNFIDGETVIVAEWMNDLNRLHYQIFDDAADKAAALTAIAPGIVDNSTGVLVTIADGSVQINNTAHLEVGDPGTEAAGIDVNGVVYMPKLRVNDIGTSNPAQFVMHRHSTTLQPLILGARSNTEDNTHAAVTANQGLFSLLGAGYTGTHYDVFASIDLSVSAGGTISGTSSPGKIVFNVTPDASNALAPALVIERDRGIYTAGATGGSQGASYPGDASAVPST